MKTYISDFDSQIWTNLSTILLKNTQCTLLQRSNINPLVPTEVPDSPWRNPETDFKGAMTIEFNFFVAINNYFQFPEDAILLSTGTEEVISQFVWIITIHSVPEKIKLDNSRNFQSTLFNTE